MRSDNNSDSAILALNWNKLTDVFYTVLINIPPPKKKKKKKIININKINK